MNPTGPLRDQSSEGAAAINSRSLRGIVSSILQAPLWAHAAALTAVLLGVLVIVGTSGSFTADEGAYIFQGRTLAETGSFTMDHPFAEVDPDGEAFPIAKSFETDDGWVPIARHLLYAWMLASSDVIAGITGMVLLSILGTVLAATAAGLLTRQIAPKLDRIALWVTGLATPLFFDAFLVMAHTLTTAACAFAVLVSLHLYRRNHLALYPALGALSALAVLLRRDGLVFMGALALVLLGHAAFRRAPRLAVAGVVVGGAALVSAIADRMWYLSILSGGRIAQSVPSAGSSFLAGRIQGFERTWLLPGYAPITDQDLLLLGAAVLGVAIVVLARVRPWSDQALIALALCVCVASVVALAGLSYGPIPGLLVACPVVLYGLASIGRLEKEPAFLLMVAGLYTLVILATQYRIGGAFEWGGRYFAPALPIAVPVLLIGIARLLERLSRAGRTAVLGALTVATVTTMIIAVGALRNVHDGHRSIVDAAADAAITTVPGDGGAPVVVMTDFDLGRLTWPRWDDARWLYAPDPATMLEALAEAGITEAVVVIGNEEVGVVDVDDFDVREQTMAGASEVIVVELGQRAPDRQDQSAG